MVCRLEKYEIYEELNVDPVGEYFRDRTIHSLRLLQANGAIYAVYVVEITAEEALFLMLSIPDISIKKCEAKVNT